MESNYEKAKKRTQETFLEYDQEEMIRRFGLRADEEFLFFEFSGLGCRVRRDNGLVECEDVSRSGYYEADFNAAMTVYDLLCWSKPDAKAGGEYVNMSSLHALSGAASAPSSGRLYGRFADAFDHKDGQLLEALKKLGGTPAEKGDAAAILTVFSDLKVLVRFWDSDEEFPSDLQLLWDKNVLSYIHYETVWYAGFTICERLLALMNTD